MTEGLGSVKYASVGNITLIIFLGVEDGNVDNEIAGPSSVPADPSPATEEASENVAENVPEDGARSGEAVLG